jgi:hypothetical protein
VRRPNRIIEIFSMSVLDMFASALGAFILISIILFPYYDQHVKLEALKKQDKAADQKLEQSTKVLNQKQDQDRQQKSEISKGPDFQTALVACRQTMAACQAAVTAVFLVIGIEWDAPCDVDLYVSDPAGHKFSFSSTTFSESKAALSVDMQFGPGVEVWQTPEAKPGSYTMYSQLAHCSGGSAVQAIPVRSWMLDRSHGLRALPPRNLTQGSKTSAETKLFVTADGLVQISE